MRLAHKYLDGLNTVEIGGGQHNSFDIPGCINVDYTDDMTTVFKLDEIKHCGKAMPVDVVAPGDELPFKDEEYDAVLSSHVFEHFPDPIKALKEWMRVIKPGGYIFMIIPHKERTFDKDRPRTTLQELIARHAGEKPDEDTHGHYSVWITEDVIELCEYLGYRIVETEDTDSKVGNGFTIILQK